MPPHPTALLTALVALGLLLSGVQVNSPLSTGPRAVLASVPGAHPEERDVPALVSKRAQRTQDRRDDRQDDRAQERQRDRKHTDRTQNRKQKNRKQASRVGDWETFCTGPE